MADIPRESRCVLFDWGDTLMQDLAEFEGPMVTWPRVAVVPHAEEALAELRGTWTLALATNAAASDEKDIWAALRRVGLDRYLDKVYCLRGVGHQKPSPEFFEHILEDLGIERSRVLMVGDSFERDVLGANRCGIRAIWLNENTEEAREGEMYRTIHSLRSLPRAIELLG
jgi:HAD superfamily hydrolase (TIGR01509 family)